MASAAQELVGLEAFSREGDKIGRIKDVICDPEALSDCVVIKHSLRRDLVVPADVVERRDEGVTVPFGTSYLHLAPRIATKGELSHDDVERLERFYHPATV